MKVAVYNIQGEDTGRKVELPAEVFGIEPHQHSVWLDVKRYLAAQRQGTHKSKERSEMSGSTRKLHKQKGTGGSRKGDINNPLYRGGGRVFGPRPRNYDLKFVVWLVAVYSLQKLLKAISSSSKTFLSKLQRRRNLQTSCAASRWKAKSRSPCFLLTTKSCTNRAVILTGLLSPRPVI